MAILGYAYCVIDFAQCDASTNASALNQISWLSQIGHERTLGKPERQLGQRNTGQTQWLVENASTARQILVTGSSTHARTRFEEMLYSERVSMIHASNAVCHYLHHMSRKVGSFLNKSIECVNINRKEMAFGASQYGCTPWRRIN